MRKEAGLELWKELYEVTMKLKLLEPWKYFWDTELIVIQLQDQEEPVFCSIMGRAGTCVGISVYEGYEGLADFDMIATTDETGLPVDYVMFEQSNLSCYFGDRAEVDSKQIKVIHDLGLKFRGKGEWIYFESYKKRCYPYIPDEREVKVLTEIYKNLFMAVSAVSENRITVDFENGDYLWRVYNEEAGEWNMFAAPLPGFHKTYPVVELSNQELKESLKKQKSNGSELILELSYMNCQITDPQYDRPGNPLMFAALDAKSGMVLGVRLLEQDEGEIEAIISFFVDYVQQKGRMKKIRARNPWIFSALEEICSFCGIRLEKGSMDMMDKMIEDMKNRM